jgi:inorganic pyrophosphatase
LEIINTAESFLGKKVQLIFDRPLGTRHAEHGFVYELNYGYVPNTLSADGEELDAYYISERKIPLNEAAGICIAYAHRQNEEDDKLIIVKEGEEYSDEQIMELIDFQEQWFETKIIRHQTP